MNVISPKDALDFIAQTNGRIFGVEFVKRTTGERRVMNCRLGVKKHLTGKGASYNFLDKGLIPVFEMGAKAQYRCVPVEGITRVEINGRWFEVRPVQRELFANEGPYAEGV